MAGNKRMRDIHLVEDFEESDSRSASNCGAILINSAFEEKAQPTGTASKASHGPNSKARWLQMSYTEGDYQDSRSLKFPKAPVYPRR